jgi:exodeoxyribonuclease VII small subunit
MKSTKSTRDSESLSFEEALSQLQQIVAQLEQGSLTLEESITLYERGNALAKLCQKSLDEAELRVVQLSQNRDGALTTTDFDLPG